MEWIYMWRFFFIATTIAVVVVVGVERNNIDDNDEYEYEYEYSGDSSWGDSSSSEEGTGDDSSNNGNSRRTKPEIMVTGICATSPQLPCCKETIEVFEMLNGPGHVADLSYPKCRPDGYFAPKQCMWVGCYCVTRNGKRTPGTITGRNSIKCEDSPDAKPDILSTGICATSPLLPCCKKTKQVFERSTDSSTYPSCRPDGFYKIKQCKFGHRCYCVTKTGEKIRTMASGGYDKVTCETSAERCQKACATDRTEHKPLCDNLGVTHANRCAFDIAACVAKIMHILLIFREGPCYV